MIFTSRSHQSAKVVQVLSGQKIFLTPNVKPVLQDMSDIIKCAGGELLDEIPLAPRKGGGLIVTCIEDLRLCQAAMEAGVQVHSTEFILSGVLQQELNFEAYPPIYCTVVHWRKPSNRSLLYIGGSPLTDLLYSGTLEEAL